MKERPILFSAPMVRAILDGTKTQTRRAVKFNIAWRVALQGKQWHIDDPNAVLACPYGKPGDRLWVRETWAPGDWMVFGTAKEDPETVLYKADKSALHWDGRAMALPLDTYAFNWQAVRWRPSIHMPRWASRITLEVTGVRVERLQEIKGCDAIQEGIERSVTSLPGCSISTFRDYENGGCDLAALQSFASLWRSINGGDSWEANPWVWVVQFKRVAA